MIPAEQELQTRKAIAELAAKIVSRDYRELFRTAELGKELGFEPGAAVFERVFSFLRLTTVERLAMVPYQGLDRIRRFAESINQVIDQIRAFRISGSSNPVNERNQLVARLDSEYFELLREMPHAVTVFLSSAPDQSAIEEKAAAALARIAAMEEKATQTVATRSKEADDFLDKIRQASGSVALQSYSSFFKNEASAASILAMRWLFATILVSAAMFTYLIWLVFFWAKAVPDYTVVQALQVGGTKIALFTVGFYAISWTGRNFKAQWHIRVINNHRANTLNALEAFSNSAKSEQTREAILIHASSAIFAQVNTGFIPDQGDAPSNPSIFEIVRGKEG